MLPSIIDVFFGLGEIISIARLGLGFWIEV
jgi:hypothetical protein